jgi:tetratricopeptide (TPR) repeat protein
VVGCLQGNFFQKAYQWATVWVEQHPNDWEANFYRAVIHEVGMRHDLAAKEYEKALELNPFFPEIHLHLARVYLLDNKSKNALPHFQEYLSHDPNDPAALLGLAQCLRSQAQPEEARAVSRQLLAVHPGDVGGCVLEAQLALEEDNYSEAQHWLRQALQVDPFDRLSNQNMAMALRHEAAALKADNRPHEAEEKQRQAKEFEEKNQQITQTSLRVEDINRELREKPDTVALRTEAGILLMKVGQYREASRWLVSAWLLNPRHQPAKDAINECLHKLGDRKLLERYQAILEDRTGGQDSEVVR